MGANSQTAKVKDLRYGDLCPRCNAASGIDPCPNALGGPECPLYRVTLPTNYYKPRKKLLASAPSPLAQRLDIDPDQMAAWLKLWWSEDEFWRGMRRSSGYGQDIAHLMRGVADMIEMMGHTENTLRISHTGTNALVAGMAADPVEVPVCDAHAGSWFTERNHLKGGMDATCIVCAHEAPRSTPAPKEPT